MSHRFYVPTAQIIDDQVTFSEEQRKQIKNVLRLGAGDIVKVFDGTGRELTTKLDAPDTGRIIETTSPDTESKIYLTLVQGIPKGDKIELILQKCTEVGVSEFLIVDTARSIPKIDSKRLEARLQRWRSIVIEAAEQSGRVRIPKVSGIIAFKDALKASSGSQIRVIAWESEREIALSSVLQTTDNLTNVMLFVGPEGGFTQEEVSTAQQLGISPVSLGPRILRTETAAIVASALVLYEG